MPYIALYLCRVENALLELSNPDNQLSDVLGTCLVDQYLHDFLMRLQDLYQQEHLLQRQVLCLEVGLVTSSVLRFLNQLD